METGPPDERPDPGHEFVRNRSPARDPVPFDIRLHTAKLK